MPAVELCRLSTLYLKHLDPPTLSTYLLHHISTPPSGPLVTSCPLRPLCIIFNFSASQIRIYRDSIDSPLDIDLDDWASLIPVFLASVDISGIHQFLTSAGDLWSNASHPLSLYDWKTVFRAMPSLTDITLRLAPRGMRFALEALHPDKSSPIFPCPTLEQLDLCVDSCWIGVPHETMTQLDAVVVDCIQARLCNGILPLVKLTIN